MPKKTCPLCGEKLKNNYCESCGYDVPDDDDLSAVYDMEPENDAFGEQVREVVPEVQAEEIYPNRPADYEPACERPKFKVRDDEGKTVHQNYQNPYGQQNRQNQQNQYNQSPPPFAQQNGNGNAAPPPSPFVNQGNGSGQYGQSGQFATAGDFAKAYWWLLLLSFFLPILGIILLLTVGKPIEQKYKGIIIAAIVLGFIMPP
ncbi:MAG: hypothetical protein K2N26_08015 [Oscillospiraceae bacterium]|nr:hypothetical protein [Oscillospiraceae bacterium]